MSETTRGDDEGRASPREGASAQDGPERALEPEVIEVTPRKAAVVITPMLVYKINGDTTCTMCWRKLDKPLMNLSCRSVIDDKGLLRSRSRTGILYVTPSRQPLGYRVVL